MQVENILQAKGRAVATVAAHDTIAQAVETLNTRKIGAVVVIENGKVAGILSERDVVRHLGTDWGALASRPVSDLMTRNVISASRFATIGDVMERMTDNRIRHMPIVENGDLVGIVSIGDVVKARIEQVEREAEEMRAYIAAV